MIIKFVLLCALFFSSGLYCAVTIDDVQKLDINSFFGTWSQFLDQVLQAQEDPMSDENRTIYNEFMDQAKKIDLSKVTGNPDALAGLQKEMNAIQKRIKDQKSFFDEWSQFCDSLLQAKEYPLPMQAESAYQRLVKEAKDLHIEQSLIDAMGTRISEIDETLRQENAKREPEAQFSRLDELEKNVNEIKEKLGKETQQLQKEASSQAKAPNAEIQSSQQSE